MLAVNSSGQLVEVFDANSSLAATFAYSGTGCSSWSGSETPDLCSAVDPGSITATYTYDSANAIADFDYDMLTATPPVAPAARPPTSTTPRPGLPADRPRRAGHHLLLRRHQLSELRRHHDRHDLPRRHRDGRTPRCHRSTRTRRDVLIRETTGYGTAAASTTVTHPRPARCSRLAVDRRRRQRRRPTPTRPTAGRAAPVSSANVLTTTDGAGQHHPARLHAYEPALVHR